MKKKQPKINSWITLILVLSVIGLLYYANIVLNRKLVEKKGYDIKQIKKKYRPFIKNIKNNESEECENQKNESQDVINKQTQNTIYEQDEENKNGNE